MFHIIQTSHLETSVHTTLAERGRNLHLWGLGFKRKAKQERTTPEETRRQTHSERLWDGHSPSHVVKAGDKLGDIPGGKHGLELQVRQACTHTCGGLRRSSNQPLRWTKRQCMHVDKDANSPGPHVSSVVRCVVIHAVEQSAIHLCYILWAQDGVRGAAGTNPGLYTHSGGERRRSKSKEGWLKTKLWGPNGEIRKKSRIGGEMEKNVVQPLTRHSGPAGIVSQLFILALLPTQVCSKASRDKTKNRAGTDGSSLDKHEP